MSTYLVAVKREKRQEMTLAKAMSLIGDMAGVEVQSDLRQRTARVAVRDSARAEFVRRLAPWCHIETDIPHAPNTLIGVSRS
jgi:hypothetical protein